MNARVYDNVIGRFLSADTIIQAPDDSQSYNRYSYVRNNPLIYTDPSGHSWLSSAWHSVSSAVSNNFRTIAAIAIGAVIAIYAPGLLGAYINSAFGVTVATGALAGFASGAIMTGTVKGALTGAVFGAIGAGVASGIGEAFSSGGLEHGANIFQDGKVAMQVLRAGVHGLSRGIIAIAQGGTFKSGFASGFTSSFLSPGVTLGGTDGIGFTLRTTIASIVGGTASTLGGGKFSNGAVSGAFVHMFNAEMTKEEVDNYNTKILADEQAFKNAYGENGSRYMMGDTKILEYMSTVAQYALFTGMAFRNLAISIYDTVGVEISSFIAGSVTGIGAGAISASSGIDPLQYTDKNTIITNTIENVSNK